MKKIVENVTKTITKAIEKWNIDNISRTVFYQDFFNRNPEIKWSFLAAMVSRNAGWSMTDLQGEWFPKAIKEEQLMKLFLTYERANWIIFADAAPQLLLYELGKKANTSFFHFGRDLGISCFMLEEWKTFLELGDQDRLMTALIINEQHVIEGPLMEHHLYAKKVFRSLLFTIQDWFHFSTVLFPTVRGELFGLSVSGFRHTRNRIKLGKSLAKLLFHPNYFSAFYHFAMKVAPTGSRYDYERFMGKRREGPMLRQVYPIIPHHQQDKKDWFRGQLLVKKMMKVEAELPDKVLISDWYERKRSQIRIAMEVENLLIQKSRK